MSKRFCRSTKAILFLTVFVCLTQNAFGDPWADSVIVVEFGPGAGYGYNFFPDNILGPPDSNATPGQPSASQQELLALGTGGRIVLAFFDGGIIDGPGPDFTVFENPFYIGGDTTRIFAETGIVAASEDGETFYTFPYVPETWEGLAGVTPTNGWANPTDPSVSGGDAFDLADVGLSRATYIQITDAADLVSDGGPSFDLDAIVAIHRECQAPMLKEQMQSSSFRILSSWPNPFNANATIAFEINRPQSVTLSMFNMLGQEIISKTFPILPSGRHTWYLQTAHLPSGKYFIVAHNSSDMAKHSILLIK